MPEWKRMTCSLDKRLYGELVNLGVILKKDPVHKQNLAIALCQQTVWPGSDHA